MPPLANPKHEQFAQLVAAGKTAADAYVATYGESRGARVSASRLLTNATIRSRIAAVLQQNVAVLKQVTLKERNFRLEMLQDRHERLRQVIQERGEAYAKLSANGAPAIEGEPCAPGAGTGTLVLDWRGKSADRAVWKVDTGLLSEMRKIEEQIARELGEWSPDPSQSGTSVTVPVQVNVQFVSPA